MKLVFFNDDSTLELKYVKSVEWQSESSDDVLVNKKSRVGQRQRSITVKGFVHKGLIDQNVKAQQELETQLRAVGTGKLKYTGADDFVEVRFNGIEFAEFTGNPICPFTIKFKTEEQNIHAHYPVKIGDLILAPTYGFEHPTVSQSIKSQGTDESINIARSQNIKIEGSIVHSSRDEINKLQQLLLDEIDGEETLVLTLSSNSGDYSSTTTVRPKGIEFSSPTLRGQNTARKYSIECDTFDDYTKEPYTLGETAATFAGISIDIVESIDNNIDYDKSSDGSETMLSEELQVSGKKYFADYAAYETFRATFNPFPPATYLYTSTSGNVLDLTDITVGKFDRDGNYPNTAKRYSATVNLQFSWKKTIQDLSYEALVNRFGVQWYRIPTITFNAQLDGYGSITARSISLNGSVKGSAALNSLKGLVGTAISYDAPYVNMYVSSVNVSSVDKVNDSGIAVSIYNVSLNASQLDTASQANYFIASLFRMDKAGGTGTSYAGNTLQLENVTNYSKSISNKFNYQELKFTVTSISLSISGEVFAPDVNGEPAQPRKVIELIDKIDALLIADRSTQSLTNPVPNQIEEGEALPINSEVQYFLSNISVGNWQAAVAPEDLPNFNGSKGARYWKQTVSLSATAVFDLSSGGGGSNTEPDAVESKSIEITEESPRFTQLQVVGFGTVFKRIGTNPGKASVSYEKKFKDASVYLPNDFGADDVEPTGWAGVGKSVKTKETREQRNLVNRHSVEYEATEKLGD